MSEDNLRDALRGAYEQHVEGKTEEIKDVKEDKEPVETHAEEEIEEKEESPEAETVTEEKDDDDNDEVTAPSHWAKEDRELFKSLDSKGREFLLKQHKSMEASYTKKMQSLSEQQKIADSFKKAVSPYENYLRQLNIDPTQAFEKLIAAEMRLRMANPHEKGAILNDLAKQYGAQFDGLPQNPKVQGPPLDEKTQLIYDELHKQRTYLMNLEQERQKKEIQDADNQILQFSSAKDANGNLKYPHFESVKQEMGMIINAGMAKSLEEAYENAVFLNKDLRKDYVKMYNKDEEIRKKTISSKKAGFNVKSGSSSTIIDQPENLSIRQALERALAAQERI